MSILLLARGTAREQEFAIRAAIGASRGVLARQLLVESLFLAVSGSALGVFVAYWGVPALLQWLPVNALPAVRPNIPFGAPVLLFSVGMAIVSGLIVGLAPILSFSYPSVTPLTSKTTEPTTASVNFGRTRAVLLGTQVALTVLVLAGSGAAVRMLLGLYQTALGYDPVNVMALTIDLPDGAYQEWEGRATFYNRLRDEIQAVPQVQSVALMVYGGVPPRLGSRTRIDVGSDGTNTLSPIVHRISPDYFSTLKIAMLRGRTWTPDENARAAHVAVVSQTMATRLWPSGNPIGQRLYVREFSKSSSQFVLASPELDGWFEIIGIASDTPNVGLSTPPEPALYVPHTMLLGDSLTMIVRATQDPRTMTRTFREAVRVVDPGQPINRLRSAEDVLAQAGWARERFVTGLLLSFAGFALALAAIGLYGLVSYSVSRRTKEFGIRTALGANHGDIVRLAFQPTLLPLAIGLVAGLGLSTASNKAAAQWAVGNLNDPLVFVTISLVLLAVATAATLVPAHRAASVKPADALRND